MSCRGQAGLEAIFRHSWVGRKLPPGWSLGSRQTEKSGLHPVPCIFVLSLMASLTSL